MIWLLLACKASESPPDETTEATEPAPYLVAEEDTVVATFEPETIEAAVNEAIEIFLAIDPAPAVAAYDAALLEADGGCPTWFASEDGDPFWYDTCTTPGGTLFDGYGGRLVAEGLTDGNYTWWGGGVIMVGRIEGDESIEMNGLVYDLDGVIGDNEAFVSYTVMSGEISYTGDGKTTGLRPEFERSLYEFSGAHAVQVSGSISGLEGALDTVAFDDVYLIDEATGMSDCSLEPSGVISVRTAEGWIDLVFDVEREGEQSVTNDASACDGCAAAWAGSSYLGEACADFGVWLE